jgi:hypothetical protein
VSVIVAAEFGLALALGLPLLLGAAEPLGATAGDDDEELHAITIRADAAMSDRTRGRFVISTTPFGSSSSAGNREPRVHGRVVRPPCRWFAVDSGVA